MPRLADLVKAKFNMSLDEFTAYCDGKRNDALCSNRISLSQSITCLRVANKLRALSKFSGKRRALLAEQLRYREQLLLDIEYRSVLVSIPTLLEVERRIDSRSAQLAALWLDQIADEENSELLHDCGTDALPIKG